MGNQVKQKVGKTAAKVKVKAKSVNKENAKKVLLSEKMNRKQKYTILGLSSILIALCLYLGITFILNHTTTVESIMNEITLDEYIHASVSKEKRVVYIATKNSKIHKEYENIVVGVLSKRKTKVDFLDLGTISKNNQIIDFMNVIELTKETYSEPMILVFEGEKIKDSLVGAADKGKLTQFLDRNRID